MYNILIVDDEKIERNGIVFLLKLLDIKLNIEEAANGKAALDILKERQMDILLTDVKMPFMDGIELIKNAAPICPDMKMIIFSGYNEFEYAKLAVKLGVSDYILKPVDPKEFELTITKVLNELENLRFEKELKSKSTEYMKEYLLYSLINGANCEDIHMQSQRMIGDDFWNLYKRMILIEFNKDFFGKVITDFANEVVGNVNYSYQYLNLNQQQAILLFDNDCRVDVNKIAESIRNKILELYKEHCYISISKQIDNYAEIPKRMEELEALMENKFYQTDGYIFVEDIDSESPMIVQIDDDTLMKQMKQDIKMKDVENLKEHFDRLCKKYRSQTYFSHIYIKFIFSNLLKDFHDNIPDMNEEEFNKEIDELYRSVDFNCIMEIVNRHIARLEKAFSVNPQMMHREIESVKEYIFQHYSEEIGVDQLAQKVYLAPSYLSSIFKKETGQNLSKYIKQYRMEKAKEMLENTHKKIVNISNEVGYPNVSYFCQSFRECFGVSPQKFRSNGGIDEER